MTQFWLKLIRRRRLERDLEDELALHRELAHSHGNAIPLGHSTRILEESRDLWRFNFLENLWRDAVYGTRGLRRSPALVFTAVCSLALGIGMNTALFSLAVEFLFSEPSVKDPASLVYVRNFENSHAPVREVEFVRSTGIFQDVAGENAETFINWNDGTETRRLFSVAVSKNYFSTLGIPVPVGRGILPNDPNEVAVLHDQFWRRHFHSDPSVIGRAIELDGKAYTVIGILPPNHRTLDGYGLAPDVYVPFFLPDTFLAMYARLKPGMPAREAAAALSTLLAQSEFRQTGPFANRAQVTPIAGFARLGSIRQDITMALFFLMLLAVAAMVLLIACVNVAGLLLARASTRKREMAIRLSIGASRARLLQQLLVESLLLSLLGSACGLALAQWTTLILERIQLPIPIPIQLHIEPDWRLAAYASLLTIFATLASGLLPARQAVRESIAPELHRANRMRLRRALVVGQVAISLIVLTTGFLFLRSVLRSNAISPGFNVHQTVRADVNLPPTAYRDSGRILTYADRAIGELEALPGIQAAAAARIIPFTDYTQMGGLFTFPDSGEKVRALFQWNAITPHYFTAMDIPIRQGRGFLESDRGGPMVAIVNRTFVARYMQGRSPIGRSFLWGRDGRTPFQIVGVVENTKNVTIGEDDQPQLYQPLAQITSDRTRFQFVLRSATPPVTQLEPVRAALRRIESGAGLEVATMYSSIGLAFLPGRIGAALMGAVGLLGLVLAAIGLYGTLVYAVTRRTQEIGVRIALGATRRDISRLILADSARLIVIGSAIGLVIAIFITRPLAMFLVPGLKPTDPVSFAAVLGVLAATGFIASWGPLRRALSIDPASCLRYE